MQPRLTHAEPELYSEFKRLRNGVNTESIQK